MVKGIESLCLHLSREERGRNMVAYLVEIVDEPLRVIDPNGCHALVVLMPSVKYTVELFVEVG